MNEAELSWNVRPHSLRIQHIKYSKYCQNYIRIKSNLMVVNSVNTHLDIYIRDLLVQYHLHSIVTVDLSLVVFFL